jgi:hypothetical protein
MSGRRTGSSVLAAAIGFLLVALGLAAWISTPFFVDWIAGLRSHARAIDVAASLLFGVVLLWWAASAGDKPFGIGFETVTMVVAAVAALIAIFTLTNPS